MCCVRANSDASRSRPTEASALDQVEIHGWGLREDALALIRRQAPERAKQATEHRAIIIEHGIVAVLEQARALEPNLISGQARAVDRAAQHPVDGAMAMIGAAVTVFTKRASEFRQHHH